MKFVKSHVRYDNKEHFFTHWIVNLWNSMSAQVVHASSVNDVKNKLDAHWSNQGKVHNYQEPEAGVFYNKLHKFHCIRIGFVI